MINKGEEKNMALREEDLDRIGRYVQERLPEWIESLPRYRPALYWEMEMRERVVRVEEELKSQRDLMKQGFDMMDKR
ncbi:MAG TPA: hypothetical protein P5346_00670, partial [Spirochaetota bacterium]|nr:hypothetical protein [Spirochaetota bacterium]